MSEPLVCTMPGRFGDILWALPTCRALAERDGQPVGLVISHNYRQIQGLLSLQPYLAFCHVDHSWSIEETAPITPRKPPKDEGYERVVHLGYESWPKTSLPLDISRRAKVPIDLSKPWLTAPGWPQCRTEVAVGFTDEHFELKYGIYKLLLRRPGWESWNGRFDSQVLTSGGSRWQIEGRLLPTDWIAAANWIQGARVFLGCCSALHVLAIGMGKPVVLMEPNHARHHEVFYPLGTTGRVTLVRGNDGQPTFDARHVAEVLEKACR